MTSRAELAAGIQVTTGRKKRTALSDKQVQQTAQRVRDVLDACPFRHVDDLKGRDGRGQTLALYLRTRMSKPRNDTDRGIEVHRLLPFFSPSAAVRPVVRPQGHRCTARLFRFRRRVRPGQRAHPRPARGIVPGRTRQVAPMRRRRTHRATVVSPVPTDTRSTWLRLRPASAPVSCPHSPRRTSTSPTTRPPSPCRASWRRTRSPVRHPIPPAVAVTLRAHLAGKPDVGERVWGGKWATQFSRRQDASP